MSKQEVIQNKWQCVRCGNIMIVLDRPDKCTRCGAIMIRDVTNERADSINPAAVKHLTTPITECRNYSQTNPDDPRTYHPLELEPIVVKHIVKSRKYATPEMIRNDENNSWVEIHDKCKMCHLEYSSHRIPIIRADKLEEFREVLTKGGVDVDALIEKGTLA